MPIHKYRLFRYFPDLKTPDEYCDFAVVVGSESELELVGVNLSEFCCESDHPLEAAILNNSFRVVWEQIEELFRDGGRSGIEVVEALLPGPSNITTCEAECIESDCASIDIARSVFDERIRPALALSDCSSGEWQETPTIQTRTASRPRRQLATA